ncbi:MAG: response regulator [Bacteroidales bacterium]|nr:response regulator [Bacteroidales bacterium]
MKSEVLIVEDIKINIESIQEMLSSPEIKFVEAENGEIAIEILNYHKPDVILMDLRMPVMDGVTATRNIRAHPDLKDIPVVAFTASVYEFERVADENFSMV